MTDHSSPSVIADYLRGNEKNGPVTDTISMAVDAVGTLFSSHFPFPLDRCRYCTYTV